MPSCAIVNLADDLAPIVPARDDLVLLSDDRARLVRGLDDPGDGLLTRPLHAE
jgi:hypothetical protein